MTYVNPRASQRVCVSIFIIFLRDKLAFLGTFKLASLAKKL